MIPPYSPGELPDPQLFIPSDEQFQAELDALYRADTAAQVVCWYAERQARFKLFNELDRMLQGMTEDSRVVDNKVLFVLQRMVLPTDNEQSLQDAVALCVRPVTDTPTAGVLLWTLSEGGYLDVDLGYFSKLIEPSCSDPGEIEKTKTLIVQDSLSVFYD